MQKNMKRFMAVLSSIVVLFVGCGTVNPLKAQEDVRQTATPPPAEAQPVSSTITTTSTPTSTVADIGDNLPVSRALAAKMIALAYNDKNTIDSMEREINFADVDTSKWYDRYVNAVYVQGFMTGGAGTFSPEAPLTLQEAQVLIDKINPKSSLKIKMTDENKAMPISYALWADLYKKLLEELSVGKTINDVFGIEGKNIIVLATSGNNSQLPAGNIVTDKGPFTSAGLSMDAYIDKEIRVFLKNGEIIAVISLISQSPVIKNAYLIDNDGSQITIFSGGVERTYSYANSLGQVTGKIGSVQVSNGTATGATVVNDTTRGIVLKIARKSIQFKNKDNITTEDDFCVYSVADGQVKWKSLNNIIVGSDMGTLFLADGKGCAYVIDKKINPETIRVAISTSGFAGLIHKTVTLSSTTAYTVTSGSEVRHYNAGEDFSPSSGQNRYYIKPDTDSGRLILKSIKRNWDGGKNPEYRGVMEIGREDGGFSIINELALEEYLYAVVPSEMPSSHGVEASTVQAITARSYAYNQFYANRYHQYGGNVDDSVSCQVYNNIPENDTSIKAVDQSRGLCLTYNDVVISSNFFSTSAGMTTNSGEVWASESKQFPAPTEEYLSAKKQYTSGDYGDLRNEANAAAFFKNTQVASFDSGFSWFRWKVEMSAKEIAASINANLQNRYSVTPALIRTLQDGNLYRSRSIDTIGELVDLEVVKRGEGGNIMEMKITGTKATILVGTEYNIRALIRPTQYVDGRADIMLNRHDGSQVANYSLMPSAFYTMEKTRAADGSLTSVMFYGGGNGHGVGMSQNGVKGMIDNGYTYEAILKHYYPGTEIKQKIQ